VFLRALKKDTMYISKSALKLGTVAALPLISLTNCGKPQNLKPNVIFILLDDYGYTDLGCYGSKYYETPNIDRLAFEGIRFTDAYAACPVSSPTRAALMTGRYPVNTGVTDWIPGRQASSPGLPEDRFLAKPFNNRLDLEETTIAEALKSNGYTTMISGKWHLGEDSIYWPEYQGFDVNKGGYSKGSPNRSQNSNGYFSPYGNPRLEDGPVGEYLTDRQTDEAITFIENNRTKPFFVYLSFYAVHKPMQGKEELIKYFQEKADSMGLSEIEPFRTDKEWIKRAPKGNFRERTIQSYPVYAAMIKSVDDNLGKLFDKLRQLDIDKNTIIIFTSDNGGLSTSEGSPTTNWPLRAGKGWLYEGGIREPLIIKAPQIIKEPAVSAVPVSTIDFFPTILEMTGTKVSVLDLDGISILPVLKSGTIETRPLFWHYPHYSNQGGDPGSAVRLGNYKLIDNFETGRQELYDLKNDISEMNDISQTDTEKTKELYELLDAWRIKTGAKMMDPNPAWNGLTNK
jgi:arylsulfatase A-like enzyme